MPPRIEDFFQDFGIPPNGSDLIDGEPPSEFAVDRERLRAFFRDELSPPDAEEVADLVAHYRAWHDASLQVLGETQ